MPNGEIYLTPNELIALIRYHSGELLNCKQWIDGQISDDYIQHVQELAGYARNLAEEHGLEED